jgi:hypothetical protein
MVPQNAYGVGCKSGEGLIINEREKSTGKIRQSMTAKKVSRIVNQARAQSK